MTNIKAQYTGALKLEAKHKNTVLLLLCPGCCLISNISQIKPPILFFSHFHLHKSLKWSCTNNLLWENGKLWHENDFKSILKLKINQKHYGHSSLLLGMCLMYVKVERILPVIPAPSELEVAKMMREPADES